MLEGPQEPTQFLRHMPCTGPVQQEALAQTLRQRTASEYRKTRRGDPLRSTRPGPRTAPGPHKDKKRRPSARRRSNRPTGQCPKTRRGPQGRSPCGTCPPHDAGRGPYAPQRRSARQRSRDPCKTRRGPQGDLPRGLSRRMRRARRPGRMRIRKAPSASATPCPPAASRCSTLGEGGLNCRVRDGTG